MCGAMLGLPEGWSPRVLRVSASPQLVSWPSGLSCGLSQRWATSGCSLISLILLQYKSEVFLLVLI